jgi:hypothetical protein
MKLLLSIIFFILLTEVVRSQEKNQSKAIRIEIKNDKIRRDIIISSDSLYSSNLAFIGNKKSFILKSRDFYFRINNKEYTGFSGWELLNHHSIENREGIIHTKIVLQELEDNPAIQIEINYLLYPNFPIVRKWINFRNVGTRELSIEALNIEDLSTTLIHNNSIVYHNYGRMKHIAKYVGDWDDPVVIVHDINKQFGIALGNETIGILKRTAYHTAQNNIEIEHTLIRTTHLENG